MGQSYRLTELPYRMGTRNLQARYCVDPRGFRSSGSQTLVSLTGLAEDSVIGFRLEFILF